MRAYLGRDREGFWVACIEQERQTPEDSCIGRIRTRKPLPLPKSATYDEALAEFRRLMSQESRRGDGC